jgi:small neutral amino acid transporter SnatA (MarC family)
MESAVLLLVLLNPFLLTVYLADVIEKLDRIKFARVLVRAAIIAATVYCSFAVLGDAIFSRVIHAEFASFQIFGGLVFLLIGLQFVFRGPSAIELLRGESEHLAGAIAMPILIGPGTLSACVVIGKRHTPLLACGIVATSVIIAIGTILLLKGLHDFVRPRNARLVERYIEIAGRVTALYVGTVAIDMIMQGIRGWLEKFQ